MAGGTLTRKVWKPVDDERNVENVADDGGFMNENDPLAENIDLSENSCCDETSYQGTESVTNFGWSSSEGDSDNELFEN